MPGVISSGPATIWVSTTGNSTGNSAWQSWNQQWTQVGTTSATATWISWNTNYSIDYIRSAYPPSPTVEAEAREAAERWARERTAVRERAEELLVALLSEEQEQTWRKHDWFTVQGSRSGRTYRIRRGYAGNVDLLDDAGRPEVTYCAHPPDVPAEDADLAQMLALVTDEDAFLAVANATPRRRPRTVQETATRAAWAVTHDTLRAVA